MNDCKFCQKFDCDINPDCINARQWYDAILMETDSFVVVPALGQLVEGYLQIVAKSHITSMGNLSADLFEELLFLMKSTSKALDRLYKKPVVFEHGAVNSYQRAGCCIDHAHWHLVPIEHDMSGILTQQFKGGPIGDPREIRYLAKSRVPYLFYIDTAGQMYLFEAPIVPSQYFRQWLAMKVGMSDKWNWAVSPFDDNIRSTIKKFQIVNETMR